MIKFILVFLLLSAWLPAQNMNLENALERSTKTVQSDLPQGTLIAVLNFTSNSDTFSNYIMQELTERLIFEQKLRTVDRGNLALVRQIMNIQSNNHLSNESARTIGQMLGAESVVFGDINDLGGYYRFRIRVLDVKTASMQTQLSFELERDPLLTIYMGRRNVTAFPPTTFSVTVPSR